MSPLYRTEPSYDEPTTASDTGGCLSGFLLPPLAVLILGACMVFVLLSASPASAPGVRAASIGQTAADSQALAADVSAAQAASSASMSLAEAGVSQIFRPE